MEVKGENLGGDEFQGGCEDWEAFRGSEQKKGGVGHSGWLKRPQRPAGANSLVFACDERKGAWIWRKNRLELACLCLFQVRRE